MMLVVGRKKRQKDRLQEKYCMLHEVGQAIINRKKKLTPSDLDVNKQF